MHQTIDYSAYTDPTVKHNAAIQDIKAYIGLAKYKQVSKAIKAIPGVRFNTLKCNCEMFLGLEGYPVEAWAKELGIEVPAK